MTRAEAMKAAERQERTHGRAIGKRLRAPSIDTLVQHYHDSEAEKDELADAWEKVVHEARAYDRDLANRVDDLRGETMWRAEEKAFVAGLTVAGYKAGTE